MFKALKAFYQQRWQRWLDRRIPREREITLNQRRIFIFLSRQGLLAALMVFTLFIAGINYANNLLLGLCFFIGSLFVIAIHHTYANLSGLRIRALATAPAFAGEWAKFTLRLDDARLRTHSSLSVSWGESEQHIAQVAAEHDVVIELPVVKRGWYRPPRLKLSTVYPLGWLRAWTWLDMDMPVLVYPHPEPLAEIPTQAGEQGDGERRRRVGQEDFDSLKAFTPGDPLAHISWKHAARGQGLLTKTFSAEEARSEILDWNALSGHTIEKRLSYLTWWVLRLSQESRPFGLVLPGQRFDIASGVAHREACLKALALFGRSDTEGLRMAKQPLPELTPSARYWQIVALLLVVLPQADRLPLWLPALLLVFGVIRSPWFEGRFGQLGKWWRLPVFAAGMAGVYQAHHSFIGPEGGVSFLILATGFKLIESQSRRDYFVLAVLDFFVLATAFLFSQSLLLAAYIGLASIGIVAALTSLQQAADVNTGHTIKKASAMALQAIPLMLVLFVFFPRLPPLWSFNLSQGTGRTGMSDSMSPGDIAKLSESSALAFRVEFQGAAPPANQLYWRGLILSHFDGQRWTQSEPISWPQSAIGLVRPKWLSAVPEGAKPIQYRVILEASDQPWLFSLAVPSSSTKKVLFTRDFRLVYQTPVFTRLSYDVVSWSDQKTDKEGLPVWMQQQNLQLPPAGNPEARRMATRWRLAAASDAAYMQQILSFFREERFFYTLEPPLLGENRIDDFFFKTRRGFCEHYASAFVFMMRAAGIPARVVAGYQGGEKSPLDNYWLVRQLDAHAWAEVWLPGQGWVRADPTSMVAPERIERGATELANQPAYWGNTGLGILRHSSFRWLHSLRNMADYVNYRWYRDVLGYDSSRQEGFMRRLLGDSSLLRQLGVMGSILALLAGLSLAWALYGGRQHQHRVDMLYRRYCKRMERRGYARQPNETPQHFAQRLAKEQPKLAKEAIEIAKIYNALRYRPASKHHQALEKRLKQLARGW